jgi:ribosome-binding factor A
VPWRPESVGRLIQENLSEVIQRRLKDPHVGYLTVTAVRVTKDLKTARVFISVLDAAEKDATIFALKRATSFLRRELSSRLRMRHTPELVFSYDDTMERGARIDRILEDLRPSKEPE